jgi:hypothetical protein
VCFHRQHIKRLVCSPGVAPGPKPASLTYCSYNRTYSHAGSLPVNCVTPSKKGSGEVPASLAVNQPKRYCVTASLQAPTANCDSHAGHVELPTGVSGCPDRTFTASWHPLILGHPLSIQDSHGEGSPALPQLSLSINPCQSQCGSWCGGNPAAANLQAPTPEGYG